MATMDAIGVVVADLGRAVQFFALLGVPFADKPGEDHLEATLPNGLRLMLDSQTLVKDLLPGWSPPASHSVGLAFRCDSAAEVDQVVAAVRQAGFGVVKEPWDAFWGQRYASVQLEPGVVADLFAWLPKGTAVV